MRAPEKEALWHQLPFKRQNVTLLPSIGTLWT